MAKRELRSPTGEGETVAAEVVDIEQITDRPIIIKLSDGSEIRLRVDVVEVRRFNDMWDMEGNPLYHVKGNNILSVIKSPEHLKKKESG